MENEKQSKWVKEIYHAKVDESNSVWQFQYINTGGLSLYEQYLIEFKGKLEKEGFFKDLIAGAGVYSEFQIEGTNQCFLNVYRFMNSNIIERGTYAGKKVLNQNWDFDVHISLQTPKGFLSKAQHNQLEKKLNKIIRRGS